MLGLSHRVLSSRVEELQETVELLQEDLRRSKEDLSSEKDSQSSHKVALERENDLLREQLKKFIVQAQRSSASESSGVLIAVAVMWCVL